MRLPSRDRDTVMRARDNPAATTLVAGALVSDWTMERRRQWQTLTTGCSTSATLPRSSRLAINTTCAPRHLPTPSFRYLHNARQSTRAARVAAIGVAWCQYSELALQVRCRGHLQGRSAARLGWPRGGDLGAYPRNALSTL